MSRLSISRFAGLILPALLAVADPAGAATVTRTVPARFTPASPLAIELAVQPDPGTRVQLVAEHVPAGWTVTVPSHDGAFDATQHAVRWGPFLDALPRTLTFRVTPPLSATETNVFEGEARFDDATVLTGGAQITRRFPGTLSRTAPGSYLPGVPFAMSLQAAPTPEVTAWIVEERLPEGWSVTDIGSGGVFDTVSRKVKWGPFFDPTPRTLAYSLAAPPAAREPAEILAVARFDTATLQSPAVLPVQPSGLVRDAPASYLPGAAFPVTLVVTPAPYVMVATVEESLPDGWIPSEFGAGGTWDAANRKLKWGPFLGQPPAVGPLTYRLTPPPNTEETATLSARGRFDDSEVSSVREIPRFREHPESTATRSLPPYYDPGVPVAVTLDVIPADAVQVYAVEEGIPAGWTVDDISHGGGFDPVGRRLKWGPFLDPVPTPRTLLYHARPPDSSTDEGVFLGEAQFDRVTRPVSGPQRLRVRPSSLERAMPVRYTPAVPLTVNLTVRPEPRVEVHAIEEEVPPGWTVGSLTDGGEFDPVNRRIKWGPFADHALRTLRYTLTPPSAASRPQPLSGRAVFNHETAAATGSETLAFNASPIAGPDPVTRRAGQSAKYLVTDLLANDSDPEADFLEIREVSAVSARGVALVFEWPWVLYVPDPGIADDSFTYTVVDPYGGQASGIVEIRVTDPPGGLTRNILSIEMLTDPERIRITWVGIPGRLYRVQAAASLVPPVTWSTLGAVRAGDHGLYEFTDPAPAAGQRFYRALTP